MKIGKIKLNHHSVPLIIPEMGINHGGKIDVAIQIAKSAKRAGAKIIKNQTHIAEDEYSVEAKKIIPDNANTNIVNIIKKCELTEVEEYNLKNYVEKIGLEYLSTPFSKKAVDRLIKFNVKAFKIGSGECNNFPLLEYVAKFKKPIILSTGMNDLKSIKIASKILKNSNVEFALNHCTNIYPSNYSEARLGFIDVLKKQFPNNLIGLSDHSKDNLVALAGISKGAKLIERHYVDSKKRRGPDISSSMDFDDLKDLIYACNSIHQSLTMKNQILQKEKSVANFAFASVVSIKKIRKGEKLSLKNIWVKRPGTGDFLAKDFKKILNRIAKKDIKENVQLKISDIV